MLPIGIDCLGCDDKSIEYFITAGSKGTVQLHMKINIKLHLRTLLCIVKDVMIRMLNVWNNKKILSPDRIQT